MKHFISVFLIFSSFAFGEYETLEKNYLDGYFALSEAMIKDDFENVKALALANRKVVDEWLFEELEVGWRKDLEQSSFGLQTLFEAKDPAAYRVAYADYSEGVVRYIKAVGKTADWQLFFCPMVETFAYWVQPVGEKIQNPYMGTEMPKCGFKKKWDSLPN